jgi:hypothetical protein
VVLFAGFGYVHLLCDGLKRKQEQEEKKELLFHWWIPVGCQD